MAHNTRKSTEAKMHTIETLRAEYAESAARTEQLRQALEAYSGTKSGDPAVPTSLEFRGVAIAAAARQFIEEKGGEPQTTSAIRDVLVARGWTTRSQKPISCIYAALSKHFVRKGDTWALPKSRRGHGA
jgi:hypothetical protein